MATVTPLETAKPEAISPDPPALQSSRPPDSLYEVIDGRIVEKPPLGALENYINNILAELLILHVHANKLGRVHVEPLFLIDANRNLKRRPDLAFVSRSRWPIGQTPPRGEAWNLIPDLAVEVVSESNSGGEVVRTIEDYFQPGVRGLWIVYPDVRRIDADSGPATVRILAEHEDLEGGDVIPGFRVAVKAILGDESADQADFSRASPPES